MPIKRLLALILIAFATIPALAIDRCFVVGDSIAYGVSSLLPECGSATKSGINTRDALDRFPEILPNADVVVISLGSNDLTSYPLTQENIWVMRLRIQKSPVVWILPEKPSKRAIVEKVAHYFGDRTLSFNDMVSPDGVHPTYKGYTTLAKHIRERER